MAVDRYQNSTNYEHPQEGNLLNVHKSMEYNALGQPVLRTTLKVGQSDAFGRLRMSSPFTLGDYKHLYGLDPNFVDYMPNGGSVTFQPNKACARLQTTSSNTCTVIHQTKFYHHYMPGKSQQILSSFNFYSATPGVTKRTGYFDSNNGIFFEQSGNGQLSWVIRTFVNGITEETRKPQSEWNIDTCDGTGGSLFNLDITKTQLTFIEFQWLGVGTVTVGFVHEGSYVPCHSFHHSNNLPTVYMSNPNLPVRCEIMTTSTATVAYFDQICSTVISEGGYVEAGQDWSINSPTARTMLDGTTVPILAIRLKNTFRSYPNRMIARMGNVNVFGTQENMEWKLIKLPDSSFLTTSTNWVSVNDGSGVEYNDSATAFTGGEQIDGGYLAATTQGSQKSAGAPPSNLPSTAKKNYIVQNYSSTSSEVFVVVVSNIGSADGTARVSMQWREIY